MFGYVTPSSMPDTGAEIAAGTKVLGDGGADGGESTEKGSFTQRLPASVSVDDSHGVRGWCVRFVTPFGSAELARPSA